MLKDKKKLLFVPQRIAKNKIWIVAIITQFINFVKYFNIFIKKYVHKG